MNHRLNILAIVFIFAALTGCGSNEEPPVQVEAPGPAAESTEQQYRHQPAGPMGYHFEGLPDGWSVQSQEGDRTMLVSNRPADTWIVAFVEPTILGDELQKGVEMHRRDAERSEGGRHLDSGAIDTTLGPAMWSLARFDEDEEIHDELVVYAGHPSEYAAVSLRYVYPSSESIDPSTRLVELVEILQTMKPGI